MENRRFFRHNRRRAHRSLGLSIAAKYEYANDFYDILMSTLKYHKFCARLNGLIKFDSPVPKWVIV